MNLLASILLCLALASCAPIPRAIIPPASEVAKLDVAPVQAAGKVTREAVRAVAKAGEGTRETAVLLRASIDRAEKIAANALPVYYDGTNWRIS